MSKEFIMKTVVVKAFVFFIPQPRNPQSRDQHK
jgi:hypothetical protein